MNPLHQNVVTLARQNSEQRKEDRLGFQKVFQTKVEQPYLYIYQHVTDPVQITPAHQLRHQFLINQGIGGKTGGRCVLRVQL